MQKNQIKKQPAAVEPLLRAQDSIDQVYYFSPADIVGKLESDSTYFHVKGTRMRLICATAQVREKERWQPYVIA